MQQPVKYADLSGKRVFVTGGATGIGASVVAGFADQGALVTFFDINETAGHALAETLGGDVQYHVLDLTDPAAIKPLFQHTSATAGGVDILINGAANDTRHATQDVTPESWRKTLAVNLDHQFFCAQAVLPAMRAAKSGVILNFGSLAWHVGLEDAVGYVASKAAIEGITHALAREAGPDGIRVNCLLPGFVHTDRQAALWLTPELHDEVMRNQCLARFNTPEDIANVALFLCSDVSQAITNQTILADAGWR